MVYSEDLRWRVVIYRFQNNIHPSDIARMLHLSLSTVKRIIARFNLTGSVSTMRMGRPPISVLLTRPQMLILFEYILSKETTYLKEMTQELDDVTGSLLTIQSMQYLLKRFGYSRKRVKRVALRKRIELVREYRNDVAVFRPEELIFIDETFCDRRISRNYGYSVVGRNASGQYASPHGPRLSVIAAISHNGLVAAKVTRENFDAIGFVDFLHTEIVPILQPYNGLNHNSVIIMDNHAAHHVAEVREIIEAAGAILMFLPPYSPELNPIEGVFSIVKQWIRANDGIFLITDDPSAFVFQAFLQIGARDVQALFQHCGY